MAASSGVDKSDPLLTMDVVREFMLSKGGKIHNHELVSHFRNFLNDPVRKVANREKIKIFVNTLAIVKIDASGDKLITLKKKFRESGNFDGDPTAAEATLATPPPKAKAAVKKSEDETLKLKDETKKSQSFDSLSEKTIEVEGSEDYVLISKDEGRSKSVDVVDKDETEERDRNDPFRSPAPAQNSAMLPPDSVSSVEEEEEDAVVATSVGLTGAQKPEISQDEENTTVATGEQIVEEKQESTDDHDGVRLRFVAAPPEPVTPKSSSIAEEPTSGGFSVKDVARTLNRLDSETQPPRPPPQALKAKRENRKPAAGDDGSGDYTMTFTELDRDWLMAASACDYMTMMKMLQTNPELAKQKDFITGYAPLHWAAKHGKPDVVKLLCGKGAVVNVRTRGGYTPLHLAAMQNYESIVELLIDVYGADPNTRDYSGRKPKQWIQRSASARLSQMLQARRTNHGGGSTPVDGPSSDSAIGKAMFLGLGAVGLKSSSSGKESAPFPRSVSSENELMPPPSGLLPTVLRAKPVQRQKDVHSDSEAGSPMLQKKLQGSDSSPNVGTVV